MPGDRWTDDQVKFLKENFENMTCEEIADKIGKTRKATQHKFNEMGLKRIENIIKIGDIFGKLKVIGEPELVQTKYQKKSMVEVECECGTKFKTLACSLKNGNTTTCGCFKTGQELHGMSNTKLYKLYKGVVARCIYPSHIGWDDYGGRGIKICEEWMNSFEVFKNWMYANGYKEGCKLSIERKDTNGNYCPENCEIIPLSEQAQNTRRNVLITAFGETKNLDQWSRDPRCAVSYNCLRDRIKKLKWEAEEAITKDARYISN